MDSDKTLRRIEQLPPLGEQPKPPRCVNCGAQPQAGEEKCRHCRSATGSFPIPSPAYLGHERRRNFSLRSVYDGMMRRGVLKRG